MGATIFTKCVWKMPQFNYISLFSFQGKSCEISEISAMSILMDDAHQNVGNLIKADERYSSFKI